MANLPETNTYTGGIYQLERTDPVDAGIGGNGLANLQALQLANRTRWLKEQIDSLLTGSTVANLASSGVETVGGSGSQGDYNLTSGTATFDQSEYFFDDFTIAAGATLNITGGANIRCAGQVTINGTINVTPVAGTGAAAYTFTLGTSNTRTSTAGSGIGRGIYLNGGPAYPYFVQPMGSGGASGGFQTTSSTTFTTSKGGDAGGSLVFSARGGITVSGTGVINCAGQNGTAVSVSSGTPGAGGGGGGSGGLILLKSIAPVTIAGTLNVSGGNGTAGVATNGPGGGGGGGGRIVIICPTINTTGSTINLAGGTNGANNGTGAGGDPAGGGGFGGTGGGFGVNSTAGVLLLRTFLPA